MTPSRRNSNILRLPDDLRDKLDDWLRDTSITYAQAAAKLNEHLAARGEPLRIGYLSIGRYDRKMRLIGERLRQSRQIAEAWVEKLGALPEGKIGLLINEILRTLAFEISIKLHEGELTAESLPRLIEQLRKLSLAVESLERATSEQTGRQREIERRAAQDFARQVEKRAAGGARPITSEQLREIVREVYGNE